MSSNRHFKILLTGDPRVGKTSLLSQYDRGTYRDSYTSTVGVDFIMRTVKIDGKNIKLEIWDTSGEEKYRTITTSYYRRIDGVILVFDLTNEESFSNVSVWLHQIQQFAPQNISKVLIGNKSDLLDSRKVEFTAAKKLADQLQIPYFETSAKDATNVKEVVMALVTEIKNRLPQDNNMESKRQLTKAKKGNAVVSIFKQLKVPILVLITATTVYLVARNYHSFLHFLSFKRK